MYVYVCIHIYILYIHENAWKDMYLPVADHVTGWMITHRSRTGQPVKGHWRCLRHMAVCQNLVPLVNIKIAGKWMFIPLKMVLIGIDPYPYLKHGNVYYMKTRHLQLSQKLSPLMVFFSQNDVCVQKKTYVRTQKTSAPKKETHSGFNPKKICTTSLWVLRPRLGWWEADNVQAIIHHQKPC